MDTAPGAAYRRRVLAGRVTVALVAAAVVLLGAGPAQAEHASGGVRAFQAGLLAVGQDHSCAVLDSGDVRCWGGFGAVLGLPGAFTLGDFGTPATAAPVDLGPGRKVRAVATGRVHACVILEDGAVRCWGSSLQGQVGLGSTQTIGDDEPPAAAAAVDLGSGRTARAITAGDAHTCAILDDSAVRCWGDNRDGRLGLGHLNTIGDDETPGSAPPVDLGAGRTAIAISGGLSHTCAILDGGAVRCWGLNDQGQLGRGNTRTIGDDESPSGAAGDVRLGAGRTATAIAAGSAHTCAVLDDGAVRCWGANGSGELGLGSTRVVGDDEEVTAVAPVDLGAAAAPSRPATATRVPCSWTARCAAGASTPSGCWACRARTGHRRRRDARHRRTRAAGPAGRCAGRWRVARLRALGTAASAVSGARRLRRSRLRHHRRRRPCGGRRRDGRLAGPGRPARRGGGEGGRRVAVGDADDADVRAGRVGSASTSSFGTTARTRPPAWSCGVGALRVDGISVRVPRGRRSPAAPRASPPAAGPRLACGWRS